MRKLMFSKLLSGVLVIAGFALFIFVGKHVFATPNATGGADNQTKDRASKRAVSLENGAVLVLEGEPEDAAFWDMGEPGAKIAAGANANAVLSLDLVADGGSGNQRDDGVTTGTVSGQGTTIAVEVFATGVRTSLRGVILKFEFDASLLSYVKAENSAFALAIPNASVGTNFAATALVTLAASGFLARAEFETVVDVTGREFAIGIESVTLAESSASQDELTTTSEISFNATPSPDFDGDGTVGFSDFLAFASGFGTQQGDAGYDARFDLDGDGSVGFSDFLTFAGAFGSEVPPSGNGGGGGTTPPPSGSPDLIVESPSVNDNTLTTGQSFTLRATVRNRGNASSGSTTLRYYRSSDATVSSNDVEVGTDGVNSLSAGGTSAESISLNAPSSAGTYYYGACVDNVSGESNTGNNCSFGVRVAVSSADSPDLIVSLLVPVGTLTTGLSYDFAATVRNQGNASSASTTLRIYRSSDATVSSNDVEVGTEEVSSLAAGSTSDESFSLNAPSDAGTYYLVACVDPVSGESNTGNNCSRYVTIFVTQPTPSGFAPADQQAFNRLVVGNRIDAESYFIDFESAGRFKESFDRDEGSYTYSHTGANAGTFTQTYDEGLYGGRCVTSLTFTSTTTGTLTYTCGNNGTTSEVESWQISDLTTPILVRATADTLGFAFLDTWSAQQTRAYDFAVRQKTTPQEDWVLFGCKTYENPSDNSLRTYSTVALISSQFLPNTTYEMRYRYRNSSSCDTGSPGPWSPIAEGTTPGSGTGGGGGGSHGACRAGLVVNPNESCTYKGFAFSVSNSGRGSISFFSSNNSLSLTGTVNGVRWNFVTSKNSGSNSWTIHTAN